MRSFVRTTASTGPLVDMEVRVHEDHHASLRLWLRLLSCSTRIESTIRQQLREQFDTTLPRFDLMAQLEREPDGLSMGDLSRRMMVTGGNVTASSISSNKNNWWCAIHCLVIGAPIASV